jgi:hypothetical protein
MASNGKAPKGTVFPESFVLHENSSKLEVQLRRTETIIHPEGRLQTVRSGNAAFPRLETPLTSSPSVDRSAQSADRRTRMASRSGTERSVVIVHAT